MARPQRVLQSDEPRAEGRGVGGVGTAMSFLDGSRGTLGALSKIGAVRGS